MRAIEELLKPGDVLLTLDGADVESAWQALALLKDADAPVAAEVLRRQKRTSVQIDDAIAAGPRVIKIMTPAHEHADAEKPAP